VEDEEAEEEEESVTKEVAKEVAAEEEEEEVAEERVAKSESADDEKPGKTGRSSKVRLCSEVNVDMNSIVEISPKKRRRRQ